MTDVETAAAAFALLGDPTRLEVVRVLGDAGPFDTLPFSTLKERVGVGDSGRFSYHLEKLSDHFVERVGGEGYRLRMPGVLVYQALCAGAAATDHDAVGPLGTGVDCRLDCAGTYECRYADFQFTLSCPDCGHEPVTYPLHPGSFDDGDVPESLLEAADARLKRDGFAMRTGRCPYCAGVVEAAIGDDAVASSADSTPSGLPAEGTPPTHRWVCTRCQWVFDARTGAVSLVDPVVAGTFAAAGVDTLAVHPWSDRYEWEERLLDGETGRVELWMRIDDVSLTAVFDGNLDVVEIRDPPATEVDVDVGLGVKR